MRLMFVDRTDHIGRIFDRSVFELDGSHVCVPADLNRPNRYDSLLGPVHGFARRFGSIRSRVRRALLFGRLCHHKATGRA